jgi:hypothetical protein
MRWTYHDRSASTAARQALGRALSAAARPLVTAVLDARSAAASAFRSAAERVPTSVLDSFPGR